MSSSTNIDSDGLGKTIRAAASYNAMRKFELMHDGFYKDLPSIWSTGSSEEFKIKEFKSPRDGITGITSTITLSPYIQADVGVGLAEGEVSANFFQTGPKFSYPLSLEFGSRNGFSYGPFQFDWTTSLINVTVEDVFHWSAASKSFNIVDFGPKGFIPFT